MRSFKPAHTDPLGSFYFFLFSCQVSDVTLMDDYSDLLTLVLLTALAFIEVQGVVFAPSDKSSDPDWSPRPLSFYQFIELRCRPAVLVVQLVVDPSFKLSSFSEFDTSGHPYLTPLGLIFWERITSPRGGPFSRVDHPRWDVPPFSKNCRWAPHCVFWWDVPLPQAGPKNLVGRPTSPFCRQDPWHQPKRNLCFCSCFCTVFVHCW